MPGTHEPLTDALHEPGFWAQDPHPHLARLRAEAPVAWNETLGYWALTRHAECHEVSTEPARFSSKKGILTLEIGVEYDSPPTMMHTDPPEHTAYRKQVQPAFKPSLMKALVPVAKSRLVDLTDGIQADEPVDFVEQVSVPFPLRIISDLLGLPDDDFDDFFYWSEAMTGALDLTPEERTRPSRTTCGPTSSRSSSRSGPSHEEDLISELANAGAERRRAATCSSTSCWWPATRPPATPSRAGCGRWPNAPISGSGWSTTGRSCRLRWRRSCAGPRR